MSTRTEVYFYDLTLIAAGDQIIQNDEGTSEHRTANNSDEEIL